MKTGLKRLPARFYRSDSGREPVREWLKSLDAGDRRIIGEDIRRRRMKKQNIGSSFDSWLREEGIYDAASANAIKRVVARQVEAAMQEKGLSKTEMARRMHTSRAALDRLLDPQYDAVTLSTLQKAAAVVGREIRLELVTRGG
jgi:antitoxin HicB